MAHHTYYRCFVSASDFASLALIINLASMLSKKQQNIDDIKESLIPMLTLVVE
ncbi:MAG: hypothetical protein WDO15_22845 [Bacteroidota bacterium]